jgi:uncharacterized protein YqgV (UPF0045/DUF77 family)
MIAAFSITPLGVGESVGDAVADAVNIEGDWDEVMGVIGRCVDAVAAAAPRVSVVIKIDHRPGVEDALTSKVEAVERRLEGS